MITHVDAGERVVQELARERSLFAKLILALRAMFSVARTEKGSWANDARGL
jgi:hypothetical protein